MYLYSQIQYLIIFCTQQIMQSRLTSFSNKMGDVLCLSLVAQHQALRLN